MELKLSTHKSKLPPVATLVGSAAVVVSIGIACVGVAGLIGWSTPLTVAGSIGLLAVIVACEIRSATVLLDAERHRHSHPVKAIVALVTFAALELVNVTAGHAGLVAIDADAAAARRAPYEAKVTEARAAAMSKAAELEAFRASVKTSADRQTKAIEKAQEGCPTCVTAATKAARNAGDQDKADALAMAPYLAAKAKADADLADAEAKLKALPTGFPPSALWGFAAILVLLKGVSVWLGSSEERRARLSAKVEEIDPRSIADLDDEAFEALDATARKWRAIATTIQHERGRRIKRRAEQAA